MNAPHDPKRLAASLDDKYTVECGRAYMNGVQALTRLPMLQRQSDLLKGLNTAGFVTGYRGSPLGGFDQSLWAAKKHLERHHVTFQPAINEDLAATAVWGTQQVALFPAKYDGVFGMWYGKAPGVDRSMDAIKHANAAGTSRYGGALLVIGDDHACKSSTLPNASDTMMSAAMVPVLYPANVQEYLDYGLHGWALSRFSGLWVALKCVTETVECASSVILDPKRIQPSVPSEFQIPPGGLGIRWPDPNLDQEARLLNYKIPAALAYVRTNMLDRIVVDSSAPRFGIIAAGKAFLDVMQALDMLGIDDSAADQLGLRVYKPGMVWPLEPDCATRFAADLEEILVVEEKRSFIEAQLKEILYNLAGRRPRIVGKFDAEGSPAKVDRQWLLKAESDLNPLLIAQVLLGRLTSLLPAEALSKMRARLPNVQETSRPIAERIPYFCSGCPHNTSTKVPEGSRALAGIGCHTMATWMGRATTTPSHMGGEGVAWIGQAPFSIDTHVFANLGDGTYFHSGYLAVRAAVAASVPITYKILFNDAVAMTGGQPVDGQLTVPKITRQLAAEGVERIVVVTDDPSKYSRVTGLAADVTVRHRDELDAVQKELRGYPSVSALIYDQTCATEKRRRRKRGTYPDPDVRVFINELVCEGCGDCSLQSNCLSVEPRETEFGRKRVVNQSSCNKDLSCVKGFCPSFVVVKGGRLRKSSVAESDDSFPDLPSPTLPTLESTYNIMVSGVGGTGVVTIGALVGMAAHIDGRGISVMDMTGLAQKGGAVVSHIRIANATGDIHAARITQGATDLVIGCDLLVSATDELLHRAKPGHTRAVVNTSQVPTAAFVSEPDWQFPSHSAEQKVLGTFGGERTSFVDAQTLAVALLGDAIFTNPLLLGYAWQKGWIPLSFDALDQAIELNGVAIANNRKAFMWGRRAAVDMQTVLKATNFKIRQPSVGLTLEEVVAVRYEFLKEYQNATYASRYRRLVDRVRARESELSLGDSLATAVARSHFKLMAYKDEYEVARLHSGAAFRASIQKTFEGDFGLQFYLAPPLVARASESNGGRPAKLRFGQWMMPVFGALAKFRFLRGSMLDPFGHTEERRTERALISQYESLIDELLSALNRDNHGLAIEIAQTPEEIRGYGHVKHKHLVVAKTKQDGLLAKFRGRQDEMRA